MAGGVIGEQEELTAKQKLLKRISALRDSIEAEKGILPESYPLIVLFPFNFAKYIITLARRRVWLRYVRFGVPCPGNHWRYRWRTGESGKEIFDGRAAPAG